MAITFGMGLLAIALLKGATAQAFINETGFGGPGQTNRNQSLIEPFLLANEHPLNQTLVAFPGFNYSTDAGSLDNATSFEAPDTPANWTMRTGLGLLNVDSGVSNYPISEANTSSNLINVAFSLEFPEHNLPAPNDTDWNLCAFYLAGDWGQDVLQRAVDDPGDCSNALGASCLNALHENMRLSMTSRTGAACPDAPIFSQIDECKSYDVGSIFSSEIGGLNSSQLGANNSNDVAGGLSSGQIFSFQSSGTFNQSQAEAYYDEYASKLWMYILTFKPGRDFLANHTGVINQGEVRTLCTILNKDEVRHENAAPSLSALKATSVLTASWALMFAWGMI